MSTKAILQQVVQTTYGNIDLTITQSADSTQTTSNTNILLCASATLNHHLVHQWYRRIDERTALSKNDIQGLKKQAIDAIKRDEHLQRKFKLIVHRQSNAIAFPNNVKRSHSCADLHHQFATLDKAALEKENQKNQTQFDLCGRLISKRIMGKAGFAQIRDGSGTIQLYFAHQHLGEQFQQYKQWDTGDIVCVSGFIFRTETGELTLQCENIDLLTKALNPLPDKYHGLKDLEQRYRQRYVDLLSNEKSRHVFITRTKIIKAIRQFFDDHDFMEVETPMLNPIPGGATARPFITHHNALDMTLYLRIAPELYLKRLIVGGFERVYEINRNFRNEGLSTRHNPEFSMLEFYQAYAEYTQLMEFTEKLFNQLCRQINNSPIITYQHTHIDFSKPFQRLSVKQAILKQHPHLEPSVLEDIDRCKNFLQDLRLSSAKESTRQQPDKERSLGKILTAIFEETVERTLIQPTFITQYPIEVSPLARRNDQDPDIADRFELFIAGQEIANGFSELNDAEDQAERFKQQVIALDSGDDEAMRFDEDYINALKYGMPPTAGEGIGIDRLVMLFTDTTAIRDVLLFPHMRAINKS